MELPPVVTVVGDLPSDVVSRALDCELVAVDTETSGLRPGKDRLELVQVFVPTIGVYLLRLTRGAVPSGLGRLLEAEDSLKVFHYAPFDLGFITAAWGFQPRGIRCTKAASKLLSPQARPEDHSLQHVLLRTLGVELDKGDVRVSDWSAPELSEAQQKYAVADVAHLLTLFGLQAAQLRSKGLWDDYLQVCHYMPVEARLRVSGFPDPLAY